MSPDMSDADWQQIYYDRERAEQLARSFIKPIEDSEAAQEALLREMSSSVLDAALNGAGLRVGATSLKDGRGGMDISNAEILKLAQLPFVVRAETYKKWHKDDKCQRDGCGKLIGNHSLKKFIAHHHVAVFNEPLEAQAEVLAFEFPEYYSAAEIEAQRGVWLGQCRIATRYINGSVVSFRLTYGFRIAIYERHIDGDFYFISEKVNEDAEARDSSIF